MKQFNAFKKLMLVTCIGVSSVVNAQTSHPLSFDSSANNTWNHYKDYVGTRLQVTAPFPSSIAGDKIYTASWPTWGGAVITPISDVPVIMMDGTTSLTDSFACGGFAVGAMTGKIALVWRGPLGGSACEFGYKALQAQNAGAIAVVIINQYPGEGPVGMAAGSSGASVTIPVFMIGNLDGIAISAVYHTSPPNTVKMTITPWGIGKNNDIGFLPGGISIWHDYAIPASQLTGPSVPQAYKGIDGAFIGNWGVNNATNVQLNSSVTFTPNGGSAGTPHTSSVSLASFPAIDSVWTMFGAEYDLPAASGEGRYDLTYTLTSDSTDEFSADNTANYSFYACDSTFSKGRYDFAKKRPVANAWYTPGFNYLWGVPYYVAMGGSAIKNLQFSASSGPGLLPVATMNFYVFKWTDGSFGTSSLNNAIETGEMELVGAATKNFDGVSDSSFNFFTVPIVADTTNFTSGPQVILDSAKWYLVAAEVVYPGTSRIALGCDGSLGAYPRTYGRAHFNNFTELYNPAVDTDKVSLRTVYQGAAWTSFTFGGASYNVDSVTYHGQIGLIPAIAMNITPKSTSVIDNSGVNNTNADVKIAVYPNPASDYVTVSLDMLSKAKTVTYTVISSAATIVRKETRNNITNDKYTFSTSKLASGNYFVVINADGRNMIRKFAVIK